MPTAFSPLGGLRTPHKEKKKDFEKLGNIRKISKLGGWPSAQPPPKKRLFGNCGQKLSKKCFLFLAKFICLVL